MPKDKQRHVCALLEGNVILQQFLSENLQNKLCNPVLQNILCNITNLEELQKFCKITKKVQNYVTNYVWSVG